MDIKQVKSLRAKYKATTIDDDFGEGLGFPKTQVKKSRPPTLMSTPHRPPPPKPRSPSRGPAPKTGLMKNSKQTLMAGRTNKPGKGKTTITPEPPEGAVQPKFPTTLGGGSMGQRPAHGSPLPSSGHLDLSPEGLPTARVKRPSGGGSMGRRPATPPLAKPDKPTPYYVPNNFELVDEPPSGAKPPPAKPANAGPATRRMIHKVEKEPTWWNDWKDSPQGADVVSTVPRPKSGETSQEHRRLHLSKPYIHTRHEEMTFDPHGPDVQEVVPADEPPKGGGSMGRRPPPPSPSPPKGKPTQLQGGQPKGTPPAPEPPRKGSAPQTMLSGQQARNRGTQLAPSDYHAALKGDVNPPTPPPAPPHGGTGKPNYVGGVDDDKDNPNFRRHRSANADEQGAGSERGWGSRPPSGPPQGEKPPRGGFGHGNKLTPSERGKKGAEARKNAKKQPPKSDAKTSDAANAPEKEGSFIDPTGHIWEGGEVQYVEAKKKAERQARMNNLRKEGKERLSARHELRKKARQGKSLEDDAEEKTLKPSKKYKVKGRGRITLGDPSDRYQKPAAPESGFVNASPPQAMNPAYSENYQLGVNYPKPERRPAKKTTAPKKRPDVGYNVAPFVQRPREEPLTTEQWHQLYPPKVKKNTVKKEQERGGGFETTRELSRGRTRLRNTSGRGQTNLTERGLGPNKPKLGPSKEQILARTVAAAAKPPSQVDERQHPPAHHEFGYGRATTSQRREHEGQQHPTEVREVIEPAYHSTRGVPQAAGLRKRSAAQEMRTIGGRMTQSSQSELGMRERAEAGKLKDTADKLRGLSITRSHARGASEAGTVGGAITTTDADLARGARELASRSMRRHVPTRHGGILVTRTGHQPAKHMTIQRKADSFADRIGLIGEKGISKAARRARTMDYGGGHEVGRAVGRGARYPNVSTPMNPNEHAAARMQKLPRTRTVPNELVSTPMGDERNVGRQHVGRSNGVNVYEEPSRYFHPRVLNERKQGRVRDETSPRGGNEMYHGGRVQHPDNVVPAYAGQGTIPRGAHPGSVARREEGGRTPFKSLPQTKFISEQQTRSEKFLGRLTNRGDS